MAQNLHRGAGSSLQGWSCQRPVSVSLGYVLSCATSSPCEGESCSRVPQPGQRPPGPGPGPRPQWPGRSGAGLEWLQEAAMCLTLNIT